VGHDKAAAMTKMRRGERQRKLRKESFQGRTVLRKDDHHELALGIIMTSSHDDAQ